MGFQGGIVGVGVKNQKENNMLMLIYAHLPVREFARNTAFRKGVLCDMQIPQQPIQASVDPYKESARTFVEAREIHYPLACNMLGINPGAVGNIVRHSYGLEDTNETEIA